MNASAASKTIARDWKSGTRKPKNGKRVTLTLEQKIEIIKRYDETKNNVEKKPIS